MTFCKELKTGTDKNGNSVIASVRYEDNSATAKYQIVIAEKNGIVRDVYKTSKTTYNKLFNKLTSK